MFNEEVTNIRYHALKMALNMTFLTEEGMISTLSLLAVLNAAAEFELFMLNGEPAAPHGAKNLA